MSRLQNGLWNKNRNLGFWASSVNRDVIAQLKSFRTTSEICLSQKKEKNMGLLAPILPFAQEVMCLSIALLPLPLPLFHDLFWKGVRCDAVLLKVVCQQGTQIRDAWLWSEGLCLSWVLGVSSWGPAHGTQRPDTELQLLQKAVANFQQTCTGTAQALLL